MLYFTTMLKCSKGPQLNWCRVNGTYVTCDITCIQKSRFLQAQFKPCLMEEDIIWADIWWRLHCLIFINFWYDKRMHSISKLDQLLFLELCVLMTENNKFRCHTCLPESPWNVQCTRSIFLWTKDGLLPDYYSVHVLLDFGCIQSYSGLELLMKF